MTLFAILFSILMVWLIWRGNAEASALMFTIVAVCQVSVFVTIADLKPTRLKRFSVSIKFRDVMQELLTGAVVIVAAWAVMESTFTNDYVVRWVDHNLHKVDPDLFLMCEIVFIASVGLLIFEVLLRHGIWTGLRPEKRMIDADLVHESVWLLGSILIAVLPAAFLASWLPNVLAGVIIPILILYFRDSYHKFKDQHSDTTAESSPIRESTRENGESVQKSAQNSENVDNAIAERLAKDGIVIVGTFERRPALMWPSHFIRFLSWLSNAVLTLVFWIFLLYLTFTVFRIVTTHSGSLLRASVMQTEIYISLMFVYIIFTRLYGAAMVRFSQGPGPTRITKIVELP